MRDRKRHRPEDANLVRLLEETTRFEQRARQALERDQLDAIAIGSGQGCDRFAGAPRALLANRGPGLAVNKVDHAAGHGVTDVGSVDQREHHGEERNALFGVEAAVDRIHQHEWVIGPESAKPDLFGED